MSVLDARNEVQRRANSKLFIENPFRRNGCDSTANIGDLCMERQETLDCSRGGSASRLKYRARAAMQQSWFRFQPDVPALRERFSELLLP
jgi:hypothetical protein